MKKRIISIVLSLALILSVCGVGCIAASAADDTASIKVGGKTYTAKVGDLIQYEVLFRHTGDKLATAQIELPMSFTGLNGYTKPEVAAYTAKIAPATPNTAIVERFSEPNTFGLTGYVMNFADSKGCSFSTTKVVMRMIFTVKKAGTYTLASKVRHVRDINDKVVVDSNYNVKDTGFKFSERIVEAKIETPKLNVSTYTEGMRIAWDPVPGAKIYRVYLKSADGWTKLKDTTGTVYVDKKVVSGKSYTYTVRCLSQDASHAISDFDRDGETAVYYAAPSLRLNNGEDGVNISWNADPLAASYRVYYRGRNGWTKLEDTTGTSVYDPDVVDGVRYTYTIRSMDKNGNHLSWYYPDGFSILFLSAPTISLSNEANGVQISWNKVTGAVKYRVYYYGSRGWTRLADTTQTSFLDTDVTSSYHYTYTVRCINEEGNAFTSDYRAGKTIRYYAAPILKLSNAEDGVSIKWDAVAGASNYRVYYKGRNGWTRLADTAGTSILDTDVVSGTNYTYTIRAMDNNDNHLSWFYTDGFRIRFIRAPEFSVSNAADGVQISWNKVGGAEKYRVFRYGSNGWSRLADTAGTSYIDKNVSSDHRYTYTVRCINGDGTAYTSDFRSGRSTDYYAAPKMTLSNTSNGIYMKWNAIPGASKYRIYYMSSDGWTRLGDTTGTSYLDDYVLEGKAYTYTIRAMDNYDNHLSWYYTDGFTITWHR